MLKTSTHRGIFIFFLCSLSLGLTLGKIIMSISMIGLFVNWLTEGNFIKKNKTNSSRGYAPLIFTGVFFLELLWLCFSKDYPSGLSSLRIKLPLLVLPLVIGTTETLNKKELKIIITSFLIGTIISSFIAHFVEWGWINKKINSGTSRDISITMSHIRYSIILSFSVILILHLMLRQLLKKWIAIVSVVWVLVLIYKMASLTAIFGLSIGLAVYAYYSMIKAEKKYQKRIFYVFISFFLIITFGIGSVVKNFYTPKESLTFEELPKTTLLGEEYIHEKHNEILENGYYLWRYIAEPEVKSAWDERSTINFTAFDKKDQELKFTLYRYLTSRGLKKDRTGVNQLSDKEIKLIENGVTSAVSYNILELRIRELLFEWQNYKTTKDPNSHSFTQRLFYGKIGLEIIKQAPVFGHGTGAVKSQFKKHYDENNTVLKNKNQLLVHNQFLTQIINLGVFGTSVWLVILVIPFFRLKSTQSLLFIVFSFMMLMAFLSDDMLERQAGVTIFATIYYLFVFTSSDQELRSLFFLKKNTE